MQMKEGIRMTFYDFSVKDNKGNDVSLDSYKGKVLLIVNTATKCGLTPQYEALETLYKKYHDQGFEILDFPCNQFLEQAPGSNEDIQQFCTLKYGTTFPRFHKIDVNGEHTHPLYAWLKKEAPLDKSNDDSKKFEDKVKFLVPAGSPYDIKWNFGKFLIDRYGQVVERYSPAIKPEAIYDDIATCLAK